MPTKVCTGCGEPKSEAELVPLVRRGKTYYRSWCRSCDRKRVGVWREENAEKSEASWKRRDRLASQMRKEGKDPARWILKDARGSDRKKGRDNDLTKPFVEGCIAQGCSYCGETTLRMTLDRVDNTLGHLQSNVVPACIRCNYARGSMPYEAWLVVAPGMRKAREGGLFGCWTGRAR